MLFRIFAQLIGEVRAHVISNTRMESLQPHVERYVEQRGRVYTDQYPSYNGLDTRDVHKRDQSRRALC